MPYMVVMSEAPKTCEAQWEPTGLLFEHGPEAGEWVKAENFFSKSNGYFRRYRVIQLSEDDPRAWRQRMHRQLEDGTLQRVPWYGYYSDCGMYEHIDPENSTMVRFIVNEVDGLRNKFTRMSPGRFVQKFLDNSPPPKLMDQWCAQMGLDLTVSKLQIARSIKDIVKVYTEGPHSCMAYTVTQPSCPFQTKIHPAVCYGKSDLGVAYILRRGEISARALVWPDKKIYGRIYGDQMRLVERFREEDYVEDWNGFKGARIRQIRDKHGKLVAPYFDGDLGAVPDGDKWLLITDRPTIILKSPYGVPLADHCWDCGQHDRWLEAEPVEDSDEIRYICAEGCKIE